MDRQQPPATPTVGFQSIQLLKTQILGTGSYGSVYKARCDSLLCAGKIIHPTLLDLSTYEYMERDREHRLPISRFMQECEFMSAIRHPNIVQFLGTYQDPQTSLPVLLMELMDDSLTHFLESSRNTLPYHIQVNFCHDITLAISYLHSNEIIHRDLSSNNVLLYGNVKAKITDFGMAKLCNINPHNQAARVSFTMCPGTEVYMPPEAVKANPIYTEKIDCFAIGILFIQIMTRHFPSPGERNKTVQTIDPRFPTIEVPVSEIERRQNHISQIDPNHPLLQIAVDCLKDIDVERPSAQKLCQRVADLKDTPEFTECTKKLDEMHTKRISETKEENKQQIQDRNEENHKLREEYTRQISGIIKEKDQIVAAKEQECQELRETISHQTQIIEKKEKQLQHIMQQAKSDEQVTAQFQSRIVELEEQLKRATLAQPNPEEASNLPPSASGSGSPIHVLSWKETRAAPWKMNRRSNAIVDGDGIVYFMASGARTIYAFKSTNDTWDQLPHSETKWCSLVLLRNLVTTIGGRDSHGRTTNQLFSLIKEGGIKRWREVFRSMPTKRTLSIVECTGQALIVAGGEDQDWKRLRTVEVMNIDTQEWSSAANLPKPLSSASATVCDDQIYIVGGFNDSGPTKSVYSCFLSDLFLSCLKRSLGEHLVQSLSQGVRSRYAKSNVWNKVADLPLTQSTCITLHGRLLAIGGCNPSKYLPTPPTSDVRIYHSRSNTWEVISKMKTGRLLSFAAVLPTNKLMVVGGLTNIWGSETDSVEVASIF